jgi:hypothetical protein
VTGGGCSSCPTPSPTPQPATATPTPTPTPQPTLTPTPTPSPSPTPQPATPTPTPANQFVAKYATTSGVACSGGSNITTNGNNPTFCDNTSFSGGGWASLTTGTYYIQYSNNVLQVSVTQGNTVATVVGGCSSCPTPSSTPLPATATPTPTPTPTASPCTCKQGTIQDNNAYSYTDCAGVFQSGPGGEQGGEVCVNIDQSYSGNIGDLIDFAGCQCS